jgi:hypothetical protein
MLNLEKAVLRKARNERKENQADIYPWLLT